MIIYLAPPCGRTSGFCRMRPTRKLPALRRKRLAAMLPVRPCTIRGLSCLLDYSRSGGLLPRRFTLVAPSPFGSGGRFVFCDTFRHPRFSPEVPAISSRRIAMWCSDFPPAKALHFSERSSASRISLPDCAEKKRQFHWKIKRRYFSAASLFRLQPPHSP